MSKQKQSIGITGAKICNNLPNELKDKVGKTSHRLMSILLKKLFTANVVNNALEFYQIFWNFLFVSFTYVKWLLALLVFSLFIYTLRCEIYFLIVVWPCY